MALPLAWRWAAERELVPAASHDEHDITSKGGLFPIVEPPSTGEPSSWPKRLEHSPSMVWL
jgi:hypothetical protein